MATAPAALDPLCGTRLAWHGVAGTGVLPRVGVGFEAALGWHRQTFRAELLGRYFLPRRAAIPDAMPASVELGLATITARACWLPLRGAWQLAGCAGASLGNMRGVGIGLADAHTRHARYSGAGLAAQIAYVRTRLAPEGGLELAGALERPRFGISENSREIEAFRPSSWAPERVHRLRARALRHGRRFREIGK